MGWSADKKLEFKTFRNLFYPTVAIVNKAFFPFWDTFTSQPLGLHFRAFFGPFLVDLGLQNVDEIEWNEWWFCLKLMVKMMESMIENSKIEEGILIITHMKSRLFL